MKKTLITLLALVSTAAGADNSPLLITFGVNTGAKVETAKGSFLGVSDLTYNIISTTTDSGINATDLRFANGEVATGFTFTTGQAVSGTNGQIATITDYEKVNTVFDTVVPL